MLWYVAIIAALNLCLGYVWAIFTRRCPRCARRRATEKLANRSASGAQPAGRPTPIQAAAPESAAVTGGEDQSPSGGDASAPSSLDSVDWGEMCQRYFGGLKAYRGELTSVNEQLDASQDDADQVSQCANRLRSANDSFIGVASATIGQLDAEPTPPSESEAGQTKLRESVRGQLDIAAASKTELDQLDVAADPAAARASLKKTSDQLHESTDELFQEVQECIASMRAEFDAADQPPQTPPAPRDPATGLVTREHAEFLIGQMAQEDRGQHPVTIALLELDNSQSTDFQAAGPVDQRLLRGVSSIVQQFLAESHTAARFSDQQLLLLVPHEDMNQAMRRAEEMRQRVATTEFMADGRAIKTTVTCALTEVSPERTGDTLFEFLQEAVTEAKRYGGNRTFTHDGNSPSPVVPPDLAMSAQQLAI